MIHGDQQSNTGNAERWKNQAPEVVSFEHFPAESSPDVTNDERRLRWQPPKRRQKLSGWPDMVANLRRREQPLSYSHIVEDAYLSFYHDHSAHSDDFNRSGKTSLVCIERAGEATSASEGHNVRKQVQMTMRCMQAQVRVQARVRARRLQLAHHNKPHEKQETIKQEEDKQLQGREGIVRKHDGLVREREGSCLYGSNPVGKSQGPEPGLVQTAQPMSGPMELIHKARNQYGDLL
ncbi:hypothetical protein Acr_00g0014040 [Actinidia rufa]|uniref:Uncharacterized protein n=1 Tax=Actinidia rufa TaxID=165716 RepID=A0A7J0DA74_9ERIC|nr:hypothetical protein Acr_00g0014040 [Actinidia rufa]